MAKSLLPSKLREWPIPYDPEIELDWSDPVTSRRLLREHLDQDHDSASRRITRVDKEIKRLRQLLPKPSASLLDAGCGPGLYAVRLAALGNTVVGVDNGPAVIREARKLAKQSKVPATFICRDLRQFSLPNEAETFDAALLIFYVLDGFSRHDQIKVLDNISKALRSGGMIVAEVRVEPVQAPGRITSWEQVEYSLLSDRPHLLLTDTLYDDKSRLYILREVAVLDSQEIVQQQTTTVLFTIGEIRQLFSRVGFVITNIYDGWSRSRATKSSTSLLVVAQKK